MKHTLSVLALLFCNTFLFGQNYHMPGEHEPHEGTWLQWPHNDLYGPFYQDDVQETFVGMAGFLQSGERVHIIAKDQAHQDQIVTVLTNASVPLGNIDFYQYSTDDAWVRDNGPIFVFDSTNALHITDWGFNGWGNDAPYSLCNQIPGHVSNGTQVPWINLDSMVLEGGAIEHDGHGTMMATRSSVTHVSRNPNLTESQMEALLTQYLGFTKFIWLDGVYGTEITDMHIDGFVHFANDSTIVTMSPADLTYWEVPLADQTTLYNATDVNNNAYNFVTVPLTQNDVVTTFGQNLGYKGSYCNYYIGNNAVLVPTYNDPNDTVAIGIIQSIYPNRTVVGVDVRNIYQYGGMIHCLTQQQPLHPALVGLMETPTTSELHVSLAPNPISNQATITLPTSTTDDVQLKIYTANGQEVVGQNITVIQQSSLKFDVGQLSDGAYFYQVTVGQERSVLQPLVIRK